MPNQLLPGAPYNQNAVQITKVDSNYLFDRNVRTIDVVAAVTVTLSDALLEPARVGDRHTILASGGDVAVVGGEYPILGNGSFVSNGSGAIYELAAVPITVLTPKGFAWIPIAAGGAFGVGEIVVPNIAGLVAIPTAGLDDQIRARVKTLDQPFELDKLSTLAPDGITIIPAKDGGNWLRIEAFSAKWSLQLFWFIDPLSGNDENTGASAFPLKSLAECCRRLHLAESGRVTVPTVLTVNDAITGGYQIKVLNDVPLTESVLRPYAGPTASPPAGTIPGVLVSDRCRFSWVQKANPEDVNNAGAAAGFEQTFNATVFGVRTLSASRAFTAASIRTQGAVGGGVQYTIQDNTLPGGFGPHLGEVILITDAGGVQYTAAIGFADGAGNARTSQPRQVSNGLVTNAVLAGASYQFISLTQWNIPLIQNSNSQGRFGFQNFELPPAQLLPNEQATITYRFTSITFNTCRIRRFMDASVGAACAFVGCSIDYHGQNPAGQAGPPPFAGTVLSPTDSNTIVDSFIGAVAVTACLFLNADVRLVFNSTWSFNACYFQRSTLSTNTVSNFITYGFFTVGAGTSGAYINAFGATITTGAADGTGLGFFDWPTDGASNTFAAVRLSDRSTIKFNGGANFYGNNAAIGSVGITVNGGSGMLWGTQGAHEPFIRGVFSDLLLENQATAIPSPELFPASWTPPTPIPCLRWDTQWAPNFGRRVMNYGTGSFISQAAS